MRFPAPIALPLLAAALAAAGSAARAGTLNVPLNHSVKLAVAGHAASVVVGNSKVADVTVVDTRTLFVTGRSPGSTDVMVVDPLGRTVYAADISVTVAGGSPVTLYRGSERADVSCSPRCTSDAKPATLGSTIDDMMKAQMARMNAPQPAGASALSAPVSAPASGSLTPGVLAPQ